MNVKVKHLHPDAVLPASSTETDAGFDLVSIDDGKQTGMYIEYHTGIAVEPPPGFHIEVVPRSSISKTDLMLANGIGVIDEGYRGEIMCRFKVIPRPDPGLMKYLKGDRIAQLVIRKTERVTFQWADELSDTTRGAGGFGSTGK